MLQAQQRMIKANAKQGVLNIQTALITIYANNLSAIATQAALIAGFAFTFVIVQRDVALESSLALAYFYYTCYTICLVAALFALSQATITTIYGPWMAFKSEDNMAVHRAQEIMRHQANFVLKISIVSISSLFAGACLQTWNYYDPGIAAICTFIYLTGWLMLIGHGRMAYLDLMPLDDISKDDKEKKATVGGLFSDFFGSSHKGGGDGPGSGRSPGGDSEDEYDPALEKLRNARALKACVENTIMQGELFVRDSVVEGFCFRKRYVSLVAGRLEIYRDEADLRNLQNPVTARPVKLYQYKFSKTAADFDRKVASVGGTLKGQLVGARHFYMQDILSTSDVNFERAYQHGRFALMPSSVDELRAREPIEFVAVDDTKFGQWEEALVSVIDAYYQMRKTTFTVKVSSRSLLFSRASATLPHSCCTLINITPPHLPLTLLPRLAPPHPPPSLLKSGHHAGERQRVDAELHPGGQRAGERQVSHFIASVRLLCRYYRD